MSKLQDTENLPASTRELGLWLVIVTTAVVYAWYFWRAVALGPGAAWRVGASFVDAVIILVVLQIVGQIVITVRNGRERTDERDRRIGLSATRVAYAILVVGVWCALGVAAMSLGTFWVIHVLLLSIVIAELARWISQIVYYRAGI